jgi:hypothetical protein
MIHLRFHHDTLTRRPATGQTALEVLNSAPQADAWAATVLIDELYACSLQLPRRGELVRRASLHAISNSAEYAGLCRFLLVTPGEVQVGAPSQSGGNFAPLISRCFLALFCQLSDLRSRERCGQLNTTTAGKREITTRRFVSFKAMARGTIALRESSCFYDPWQVSALSNSAALPAHSTQRPGAWSGDGLNAGPRFHARLRGPTTAGTDSTRHSCPDGRVLSTPCYPIAEHHMSEPPLCPISAPRRFIRGSAQHASILGREVATPGLPAGGGARQDLRRSDR